MTVSWERALVTGASRGIGEAFARRLARDGTDLVLVARSTDALERLAEELRSDHAVTVEVHPADLATRDGRAEVEARLTASEEPVDLLINNAGVGVAGAFVEYDRARQSTVVEVDVIAVQRLAHAAARAMVSRGAGGIVNVSSVTAFQPIPYGATYGASKAFVLNFTEALHEELRGTGVRVLGLCPGLTRTEIFQRSGGNDEGMPDLFWSQTEDVVDTALRDLSRGVAVSVPGLHNKLAATTSPRTPGFLQRRITSYISRRLG